MLPPFHPWQMFSFLVHNRQNKQTSVTIHCPLKTTRSKSKGEKSFLLQLYILWINHVLQMMTKVPSGENNILFLERNNFSHMAGHVPIASCWSEFCTTTVKCFKYFLPSAHKRHFQNATRSMNIPFFKISLLYFESVGEVYSEIQTAAARWHSEKERSLTRGGIQRNISQKSSPHLLLL